jgi:hypothetical protein
MNVSSLSNNLAMQNKSFFHFGTETKTPKINGGKSSWLISAIVLAVLSFTSVKPEYSENLPAINTTIVPTEMGIIVPAYFYPNDWNNPGQHNVGPYWSRLIEAARILGDRLIVIANPGSGPGTGIDAKYTEAIDKVRAEGGKVIGYVHTCYGLTSTSEACVPTVAPPNSPPNTPPPPPRSLADIHADIDKWYNWYDVDGIFLDEVSTDTDKISWYQALHSYIRGKSSTALICNNFGQQPAIGYLSIDAIACVYESYTANFDNGVNFSYLTPAQKQKSLVLLHTMTQGNWNTRFQTLSNEGIKWFYITNDQMNNPWDVLPPFFEEMVIAIVPPPVSYWNFEEGTGTNASDAFGGNQGTLQNGPTWTTVTTGNKALAFDGANDYIEIGYPQNLYFGTSDFTYEAWIKISSPVQQGVIMGKYNHYPMSYIRINTPGRLEARIGIGSNAGENFAALDGEYINPEQWHHVTAVFDRDGDMTRYLDGQVYGQPMNIAGIVNESMNISEPFNPFRIGANSAVANPGGFFKGQIDDVAVYRRALTKGEIEQRHIQGRLTHPL